MIKLHFLGSWQQSIVYIIIFPLFPETKKKTTQFFLMFAGLIFYVGQLL